MKLIGSSTLIIPSEWKCLVRDECLTACDFSSFFFKCNANTNMKTFTAFVLLGLVAISLAARPHAEFAQFIRKYTKCTTQETNLLKDSKSSLYVIYFAFML